MTDKEPLYTLEQVKDVAQKLADCALMSSPPKPTKLITVGNVLEQAGYVKKKEWVGLTEDEATVLFRLCLGKTYDHFWQAIEAKLKEKNT